jgi:ATP-binding cassette subfamily B protein
MNDLKLPSAWRALWLTGRIAFRASPWLALGSLMIPIGWLQGQAEAVASRFAVDGVATHHAGGALAALVALMGIRAAWRTFDVLGRRSVAGWQERASVEFDRRLALASARLPGLAEFENPAILDLLHRLRSEVWKLHWTFESLMEAVGAIARFAITCVLLASLDPRLLLLPLAGLPSLWAGASGARMFSDAEVQSAEAERQRRHLFEMATASGPAKEVRVARIGGFLRRKAEFAWRHVEAVYRPVQMRASIQDAAGALVVSAGFVAAVLLMLDRARRGQASPGEVLMAVMLGGQATGMLASSISTSRWTLGNLAVSRRFVWLLDRADAGVATSGTLPAPTRIRNGISVREVTFSYSPTLKPALDRISLELPAGSVVAIVGENGAGKTSLVKLLCRLYEPDGGCIEVDGVDIKRVNRESWRTRIASGFQDFCRLEFVMRESAGVGDLKRVDSSDVVMSKLHLAGAARVTNRLPLGLEHQLGTRWPGGADLSTGEWQKVALARMLMRDAPLLVVLDEPTASLDAPAEAALFERYAATARDAGRRSGAITVLVSHRFSTVRMADLIVVIERGQVIEQGTHAELVAADGVYASLVGLQRRLHGG